jgi:hypothetical protein
VSTAPSAPNETDGVRLPSLGVPRPSLDVSLPSLGAPLPSLDEGVLLGDLAKPGSRAKMSSLPMRTRASSRDA